MNTPLHRRLLVLTGNPEWCRRAAGETLRGAAAPPPLWIGESPPDGVRGEPARKVHRILGGECDLLVFDALDGFDPDAFGAASGTLRVPSRFFGVYPHTRLFLCASSPVRRPIRRPTCACVFVC